MSVDVGSDFHYSAHPQQPKELLQLRDICQRRASAMTAAPSNANARTEGFKALANVAPDVR